ncbi:MAG: hypothetical protein M1282_08320, partial [Chloroflexi bacterium]|nr:hypothetical protein [Chloroflexota bacterium]
SREDIAKVIALSARTLCSEWPEYCDARSSIKNRPFTEERLRKEGKGAAIATNIGFASGFLANRVALHLLRHSAVKRNIAGIPEMPGYCYLDAAMMEAKTIKGRWW